MGAHTHRGHPIGQGTAATVDFPAFANEDACSVAAFPPDLVYPASVVLFQQGLPVQEVHHLKHGLVKLLQLDADGDELIVGLRSAGWFLGAAAAILGEPYVVSAVTVTSCRVSRVTAVSFREIVATMPEVSWQLHRMHSREIYRQVAQVADLSRTPAVERLMRLLRSLSPSSGPGAARRSDIPLRQWEIAQLLGITPSYLSQLLKEVEKRGLAKRVGNRISLSPRASR